MTAEAIVSDGRFTRRVLDQVLRAVCVRIGLDHRDATLVRFTNNAVYSLARDRVVVRIVGSRALRHRAEKVVLLARYLAHHGVPAVRLVEQVPQPLVVGEHAVTVWHRVDELGRGATSAELAWLLRRVHALPPADDVGGFAPLRDVRARIGDAEQLDPGDRRFLLDRCAEVEAALTGLDYVLPPGLVHGDAHPGNVIVGVDGPVLCDFDSSCAGPPEWDLTPLAVARERFRDPPERYGALAEHYGFDVTTWGGFGALRDARELKLATSVLPILRSNPAVRVEWRRRLDDLREGRRSSTWTRYR